MGLGSGIRDPEKTHSGFRIQGSKRHRIPDPDPQHCKILTFLVNSVLWIRTRDEKIQIRDLDGKVEIPV